MIHLNDLIGVAQALAAGQSPTAEDLALAVQYQKIAVATERNDGEFNLPLLRLLQPWLDARVFQAWQAGERELAIAVAAGAIGVVHRLEEARQLFYTRLEMAPERLDFSEAPDCFVAPSGIHGEGLYARKDFARNAIVADYHHNFPTWPIVPYTHIHRLPQIYQRAWFVGVDQETFRVVSFNSTFMRANHSRQPNTIWSPENHTLTANQLIPAGTEITFDYRLEVAPPFMKDNLPAWA